MLRTLGPPQQARLVGAAEAAGYTPVAPRLIRFWQEHGRRSYFEGMYWICDPTPFDAVLGLVFNDDPEFDGAEMTAVAYTALGRLTLRDRRRVNMNVNFTLSQVSCPPERSHINSETGERFPDDYMIGATVDAVVGGKPGRIMRQGLV